MEPPRVDVERGEKRRLERVREMAATSIDGAAGRVKLG
jgi:hypothetical protein